jgi:hypothetical protein
MQIGQNGLAYPALLIFHLQSLCFTSTSTNKGAALAWLQDTALLVTMQDYATLFFKFSQLSLSSEVNTFFIRFRSAIKESRKADLEGVKRSGLCVGDIPKICERVPWLFVVNKDTQILQYYKVSKNLTVCLKLSINV